SLTLRAREQHPAVIANRLETGRLIGRHVGQLSQKLMAAMRALDHAYHYPYLLDPKAWRGINGEGAAPCSGWREAMAIEGARTSDSSVRTPCEERYIPLRD